MLPAVFSAFVRDVPQVIFAFLYVMLATQDVLPAVTVFHVILACLDMRKFQHLIATANFVPTPTVINAALMLPLAHIVLSPGMVL